MSIKSLVINFNDTDEPTRISLVRGEWGQIEKHWEKPSVPLSDRESNRVDASADTNVVEYWLTQPFAIQNNNDLAPHDLVMAIGFDPDYDRPGRPKNGEIYVVTVVRPDWLISVKSIVSQAEYTEVFECRRFAFVGRPDPQDDNWIQSAADGRNPAPGYEVLLMWGSWSYQFSTMPSETVDWNASHKFKVVQVKKIKPAAASPKLIAGEVLTKETMKLLQRGDRVQFIGSAESNGSSSDAIPWGKSSVVNGAHGAQVYIEDETHGYHYTWLKFLGRPVDDHTTDALQYAIDAKKAAEKEPFTLNSDGSVTMNNVTIDYPYITKQNNVRRQGSYWLSTPRRQGSYWLSTPRGYGDPWVKDRFYEDSEIVTFDPNKPGNMPANGTWLGAAKKAHLFVDGDNLETMSDDLRERVNAMLPAGATLTGVAYYPKPKDKVKIMYEQPVTVVKKMRAVEGREDHDEVQ